MALRRTPSTLPAPARRVDLPSYDRTALTPAVVHFGVGGFHRAHQLSYFDELASLRVNDWGVVGVGISSPRMGQVLSGQDNLFTVVQRGSTASTARVVGVMVEYLLLAEDRDAVLARLIDPRIRLVTLTITGDGYAAGGTSGRPSVFTVIAAALDLRRQRGITPFTVLSCDNLPDNGAAARSAVVAAAEQRSTELAAWIDRSVAFPDSMVDRITPVTSPGDRRWIEQEFQVNDGWPVITEPFSQWVIEDRFGNERPPLDRVGVRYVDDVAPYKLIKTRMLNGAHCALGYLGTLAGHRRTDEAMADPVIGRYVAKLLADEIAPLLPQDVPGMELGEYRRTLIERFGNPAVGDGLARLCRRGSTKMPAYLLPSLHAAQAAGRPRDLLLLAVAAWLRYLHGVGLRNETIEVEDARLAELRALAAQGPAAVLTLTDVFADLAHHDDDVRTIETMISSLDHRGLTPTMRTYL
ncbi:Mannitol dehydrogenase domain protein [Kribbella flavida DSM 17836]|uniref:Mannitol-1-phosphate 5-dehydrogenase n=1 Tax=Kribbella flavida (strain DSM 17836 / JCM 10339 / NBRC 14399) TaxID=479435 RepID=D2Q4T8_KRIFD|nr:mannitol dehydrogenase family protein [Kribbella flavida]ADB34193.1 Mannitol dehydrogenase domain protein [Kribbella flavida DSM 17836]